MTAKVWEHNPETRSWANFPAARRRRARRTMTQAEATRVTSGATTNSVRNMQRLLATKTRPMACGDTSNCSCSSTICVSAKRRRHLHRAEALVQRVHRQQVAQVQQQREARRVVRRRGARATAQRGEKHPDVAVELQTRLERRDRLRGLRSALAVRGRNRTCIWYAKDNDGGFHDKEKDR